MGVNTNNLCLHCTLENSLRKSWRCGMRLHLRKYLAHFLVYHWASCTWCCAHGYNRIDYKYTCTSQSYVTVTVITVCYMSTSLYTIRNGSINFQDVPALGIAFRNMTCRPLPVAASGKRARWCHQTFRHQDSSDLFKINYHQ